MNTQYKQLYRSRSNRMIGGVCAGLGEFFEIKPAPWCGWASWSEACWAGRALCWWLTS